MEIGQGLARADKGPIHGSGFQAETGLYTAEVHRQKWIDSQFGFLGKNGSGHSSGSQT